MVPLETRSSFLFREFISSWRLGKISQLANSIQLSYLGNFVLGDSIVGLTIF